MFTGTSPRSLSSTRPFNGVVFGVRPTSRKTPSTLRSYLSLPSTDSNLTHAMVIRALGETFPFVLGSNPSDSISIQTTLVVLTQKRGFWY